MVWASSVLIPKSLRFLSSCDNFMTESVPRLQSENILLKDWFEPCFLVLI